MIREDFYQVVVRVSVKYHILLGFVNKFQYLIGMMLANPLNFPGIPHPRHPHSNERPQRLFKHCKREEQNFILHNYFIQLQMKTVLIVCSKPEEAVFNLSWLGAIHL